MWSGITLQMTGNSRSGCLDRLSLFIIKVLARFVRAEALGGAELPTMVNITASRTTISEKSLRPHGYGDRLEIGLVTCTSALAQ